MTTELRTLPCALTPAEVHQRVERVAALAQKEDEILEEMAGCRERLKAVRGELRGLYRAVATGTEDRDVPVDEWPHWGKGEMQTVRRDTGEVIERRELTAEDRQQQLFRDPGAAAEGSFAPESEVA